MKQRLAIRSDFQWIAAFLLCECALLAPAAYNRFPLLFPDSDAYFEVAYGHQWTLDRSGFYGLFLKPLVMPWSGSFGLWLAIAAQAGIVIAIMLATIRRMIPRATAALCASLILMTALITSLSWHTAQLMPDAFTGALVLIAWLVASRDADAPGSPLLWLCTGALALVHYTHLPLLAITVLTTFGAAAASDIAVRRIGKRALVAALTIATVVAAHVAANGLMFDRWTVSPMGGWFLFARVHQDGLVDDWLARHCGRDAPAELCKVEASLPKNSQILLWSRSSPLYPDIEGEIGTPAYWHWTDMLGRAAVASIHDEPLAFLKNSAVAAKRQFLTFGLLDDHCPLECNPTALIRLRPGVEANVRSSRQLTNEMHPDQLRVVSAIAEGVALLAIFPLLLVAIRRRDAKAQVFLAAIVASLVANAAITGALSDVQPRYESRVVWLAMFAAVIVLVRWSRQKSAGERETGLTLKD